jgi:hypothetical protein
MNKSVIYIVGATVLVGGAYLFLKNKKAKDLAKLDEIGEATPSGTTSNLSTTSDGVTPSDASINLSNAVVLVPQRMDLYRKTRNEKNLGYKQLLAKLVEIDKKLANLGYKVDANGLLIKIGANSSDANVNLANANLLFPQRMDLYRKTRVEFGYKLLGAKLVEIDKKLANLGYKVDANGQLVKI